MTEAGRRVQFLPISTFTLLNNACIPIREAFDDCPYLVGSVLERGDWRDVDVRLILDDSEFDALFRTRTMFWSLLCLSVSQHLSHVTGVPVDFQVQRQTEANAEFKGKRHPLGMSARPYAGGPRIAPDS